MIYWTGRWLLELKAYDTLADEVFPRDLYTFRVDFFLFLFAFVVRVCFCGGNRAVGSVFVSAM